MANRTFQPDQSPLFFHISDAPHENYFFANNFVSCHTILTSPLPRNKPNAAAAHRLLFAWPGGNSGAVVFFKASSDKEDESLRVKLLPDDRARMLTSIKTAPGDDSLSNNPSVGVSGLIEFSREAILDLAVLGSVRTVRDYAEGQGILNPKVQRDIQISHSSKEKGGVDVKRIWFDRRTTTTLTIFPSTAGGRGAGNIRCTKEDSGDLVVISPGVYSFQAHVDFPQLSCMHPASLLRPSYYHLISQNPDAISALSFMSSSDKLLAGSWRFLTYFGRDTLISLLLLGDILSEGEHGAIEAGLGAVLERINWEDGSVCHEENIGDYPAAQAALTGDSDTGDQYDYKMVLSDHLLLLLPRSDCSRLTPISFCLS